MLIFLDSTKLIASAASLNGGFTKVQGKHITQFICNWSLAVFMWTTFDCQNVLCWLASFAWLTVIHQITCIWVYFAVSCFYTCKRKQLTGQPFPASDFHCSRMWFTTSGCLGHELIFLTNPSSVSTIRESLALVSLSSDHSEDTHLGLHDVLYLLLQAVFPLFQADFFGPHQLQCFFGDGVLQPLHALDRCCPCRLAKLPLISTHPLIQSCNIPYDNFEWFLQTKYECTITIPW